MRDDSRPVSELREALDAARGTGGLREALNAVRGTTAEADESADDFSWAGSARQRQWPRRLGRAVARVDTWILTATVAGVIVAVAGVVIAYLTLVKPG